jgi:hypothetical protein
MNSSATSVDNFRVIIFQWKPYQTTLSESDIQSNVLAYFDDNVYFEVGQYNWDRRNDMKILHDAHHALAIDKGGLKPSTLVTLNIPLSGTAQFKDTVNTTHSNSL